MNSFPTAIHTVWWMIRDTFRQSLATKLFWAMLGISGLCTLFCFGISISGDDMNPSHPSQLPLYVTKDQDSPAVRADGIKVAGGEVYLGFGLFKYELGKNRADAVGQIQLWMAGYLADTLGVLLALLWTAGFLPTFLEPQAVTVLLAKPAPRWSLLLGKYLGVVFFVGIQAILFVGGTWIGLGVRTGVWNGWYWFAVPLLLVNFAAFYAFSAFLAVCTRSTVVSVFGTLLFWLICWLMNDTHHRVFGTDDAAGLSPAAGFLIEAGYWVLPKPLDLSAIFYDALRAKDFSMEVPEVKALKDRNLFYPVTSVFASLAFAVGVLAVAAYEFKNLDY